jgi:hypothetical protein
LAITAGILVLRRLLAATTVAVCGCAVAAVTASDATLVTERLRAVSHQKECRVTTMGRRSGNPHTVTTWFVVEGDTIYLGTLDVTRDWVRNARAKGQVTIDFGTLAVTGTFADVTDPEVDARVHEELKRKYWIAWLGSWFRQGPERTFRVGDLQLASD